MRERLSYSNVMATLAVFVALGGTSYAAITITGKNVKNGSLTGADVKKHSVQLDRLIGKLPAGARGLKGDTGGTGLQGPKGDPGQNAPVAAPTSIAAIASTSDNGGYWLVDQRGAVHAFGNATFAGDLSAATLGAPIVDITATSDDKGYWLVDQQGHVFAFGDAPFAGGLGG
jgi:hypothetical protein